ncbi:hypothetical protein EAY36_26435, partial [Vibrio anguillarum]|nr:hypothetical protein [Vibrio anguillarum]
MERTTRTKINTFSVLVALFRFCDENNIENILTVSTIAEYLKKSVTEYHKGKKGKNPGQKQGTLISFVREYDFKLHLDLKPF